VDLVSTMESAIWPVVVLLGMLVMVSIAPVVLVFLLPAERAAVIGKLLAESHALSRLVTLVTIVPLLGILALRDKIDGATAATALSAIAGYVLGSTSGGGQ
jgi:hypothetical protein